MQTRVAMVIAAALLAAVGCASKDDEGGGGVKTFTLQAPAFEDPRPTLTVTARVPAGWKIELEKDGTPHFELPSGTSFFKPTLVFLTPAGDDDAARLQNAISLQFNDEDLATARREELGGGRVWIAHTHAKGVHARLFVPVPAKKGVVMCVAMLTRELVPQLPEIRSMCETVAAGG